MKTGYEVTFRDFQRLVSDAYCLPMVAPLLKAWFNYDIAVVGPPRKPGTEQSTRIYDASGTEIGKARLHLLIQADPEMQGSLYRTSQTLWR